METRYFLGKDFLTDNDEDINYFNNEIKERVYCDPIGLKYRVYSGKLATFFIAENLSVEVEEMGERKLVPIQGKDFADAYQSEYDRGKAWFNQTYPLADLLSNTEIYIPRLRKIYFHDRFRGTIFPGLRGFKGLWANPITVEWVKQIGYHSGIIAEMERLDELHLPLFADLEQWQHGEAKPNAKPPKEEVGEQEQTKLSHPQIAILHHLEGWTINKNNANEIAIKYGQTSGQRLADTFKQLTSELVRTAKGKNTVTNYRALENIVSERAKSKYDKELGLALGNNAKKLNWL